MTITEASAHLEQGKKVCHVRWPAGVYLQKIDGVNRIVGADLHDTFAISTSDYASDGWEVVTDGIG